jgi:S1-C subfamily serine protease
MIISSDGSARLALWTSQHPETGLVVTPDGSIAGFGLSTGMLTAATCKPIVDQIISTGQVHRAVLGVLVREIRKEDVLRQSLPALGARSAIRVEYVDPNSAAQRGGLHVGDLILAIEKEPVGETQTFAALIATRSGKTTLHVLRDSKEMDVTVDLQPQ